MDQRLAFSIVEELKRHTAENEGLEVAAECVQTAFNVDTSSADQLKTLAVGSTLSEIFAAGVKAIDEELDASPHFQKFIDSVKARGAFKNVTEGTPEYAALYGRAKAKYQAVQRAKGPVAAAPAAPAATEADTIADGFKEQGNQALKSGKHEKALGMYTKAIETSGEGKNAHVYYCNRAAVHSKLGDHAAVVEDCTCSLAISPEYVKAHSRLAQALFALERYDEAQESCENALRLDPKNAVATSTLKAIKAKKGPTEAEQIAAMSSAGGSDGNAYGSAGGAGGMPDMASMMAAMGGGGGGGGMPDMAAMMAQMGGGGGGAPGGGGGGMPDLSAMMAAMGGGGGGAPGGGGGGMPDLAGMMAGMGGGGGGMPDMASMMQNPAMMQAAQQMMQNPQMAQMAQQMMSDPAMMQNMMSRMGGGGGAPPGGN